jgi:hypothetical protein
MAASRTERRWSKEPRMETTLSVMVWLFCSDSLIFAALSLSESVPTTATPIFFFFFFFFLFFSKRVERERERGLIFASQKIDISSFDRVYCFPASSLRLEIRVWFLFSFVALWPTLRCVNVETTA